MKRAKSRRRMETVAIVMQMSSRYHRIESFTDMACNETSWSIGSVISFQRRILCVIMSNTVGSTCHLYCLTLYNLRPICREVYVPQKLIYHPSSAPRIMKMVHTIAILFTTKDLIMLVAKRYTIVNMISHGCSATFCRIGWLPSQWGKFWFHVHEYTQVSIGV